MPHALGRSIALGRCWRSLRSAARPTRRWWPRSISTALVDRAERVVLARVESQVARWTGDHDAIYTDVTVRVLAAVQGRRCSAGDADHRAARGRRGRRHRHAGVRRGALHRRRGGGGVPRAARRRRYWTVGMAQGKLRVTHRRRAQDGGPRSRRPRPSSTPPAAVEPAVRPLDELARRRSRARGQGARDEARPRARRCAASGCASSPAPRTATSARAPTRACAIAWPGSCVYLSPTSAGSPDLPLDVVLQVITKSIANWQTVDPRRRAAPT